MKLDKKAFALTMGILGGAAIFLATIFLLITGTEGSVIRGLRNFCFGYSFSFIGSLIGLIWGFIYGFISGWIFVILYNLFAKKS